MVLAAAASLQVGAAFAVGLFDEVGPGGAVFLRLGLAALVLVAFVRPPLPRGRELRLVAAFGVALGLMNWSIYEAMDRIPLGIAVTIEFAGPLAVAVAGSRRPLDGLWIVLAAAGIVLLADPGGGRHGCGRRPLRARRGGVLVGVHPALQARRGDVPRPLGSGAGDGLRHAGRAPGGAGPGWERPAGARGARRRRRRRRRLLGAPVLAPARGSPATARGRLRRADAARAGGGGARRLGRARAGARRAGSCPRSRSSSPPPRAPPRSAAQPAHLRPRERHEVGGRELDLEPPPAGAHENTVACSSAESSTTVGSSRRWPSGEIPPAT